MLCHPPAKRKIGKKKTETLAAPMSSNHRPSPLLPCPRFVARAMREGEVVGSAWERKSRQIHTSRPSRRRRHHHHCRCRNCRRRSYHPWLNGGGYATLCGCKWWICPVQGRYRAREAETATSAPTILHAGSIIIKLPATPARRQPLLPTASHRPTRRCCLGCVASRTNERECVRACVCVRERERERER